MSNSIWIDYVDGQYLVMCLGGGKGGDVLKSATFKWFNDPKAACIYAAEMLGDKPNG